MGSISNAQQTRPIPSLKSIDLHCQDFDLLPIVKFVHSFAQVRRDLANVGTERIDAAGFDLVIRALCDDEACLKIVRAIDQDQRFSIVHVAEHLRRIVRRAADSEPQDIDGHSVFDLLPVRPLCE